MNNLERMKLIKLGVKDLEVSVCAYEYARKNHPDEKYDFLWGLTKYNTRESICRRIKQLRQDLLQLVKEYGHGRE